MSNNYYDVLGVDKDASDKDITKAFRKLSMKYHPDRQADKNEEEKAEAEAKFKEINEAYSVLNDPQKKENYDRFGSPDGPRFDESSFGGSPFGDFFGSMFGGNRGRQQKYHEPGEDIKIDVRLSLEDVFVGCTKTVTFDRNIRCMNCHGEGGTGRQTCRTCHGTGYVTKNTMIGGIMMQQRMTCQACKGTGFTIQHKCPTCGGTGAKSTKVTTDVYFPPAMKAGFAIERRGEGHESMDRDGMDGNLYLMATYDFDTNKYTIQGLDVIEVLDVPYYDALLGVELTVELPNHEKKRLKVPSCVPDGKLLRLYREGIESPNGQKGDYYFHIRYIYPESLTDKERKALEDIKVANFKTY